MKLHPNLRDRAVPSPEELQPKRAEANRIGLALRRLAFGGPVLGFALAGTWLGARLTASGGGAIHWLLLALVFANLLYVALVGWPGVLGGLLRLSRPARVMLPKPNATSRTAVLMPVYNEDPRAVFAAVEVMARAIADYGLKRLDIFILSDTQEPAIAAAEASAYDTLLATTKVGPQIYYRRRTVNDRRKAGNLADFCENWGRHYDYMVVLDADSLMGAGSIAAMIGLMDANPRTGLIQTVPYPVGRETLFARIQQFAARLYTPLLVEGLAFWHQADGNYWGHNAIIRIAPFMEHCDLPVLPGREPFGGEILCHDVVEAALMRRGGWDVWMRPDISDSLESLPANMVDYAVRERRWCQGNLQHLGVLPARGLRLVGRYHLLLGVTNYLAGPLLVAFAGLATLDGLLGGRFAADLLGAKGWEHWALLGLVLGLLYGAKLFSLAFAVADPSVARLHGGRVRLLASAVLEQAAAMVSAPVQAVLYTRFITMMLCGRTVRWTAQPRDDRGVSWSEAWQALCYPAVVGAVWLAGASALGGPALAWSATLVPGLLLAIPFAVWSSRAGFGVLARRAGLFLIQDETAPSPILRAFQRAILRPADRNGAVAARPALPQPAMSRMRPQFLYLGAAPEGGDGN